MDSQQCSEIFEQAFSTNCAGIVRQCSCGITHYDYDSGEQGSYDEGEFDELEKKHAADPAKYVGHDGMIATMNVAGHEVVIGCTCTIASDFERFLIRHSVELARYLNLRAEAMRKKAHLIEVKPGVSEGG